MGINASKHSCGRKVSKLHVSIEIFLTVQIKYKGHCTVTVDISHACVRHRDERLCSESVKRTLNSEFRWKSWIQIELDRIPEQPKRSRSVHATRGCILEERFEEDDENDASLSGRHEETAHANRCTMRYTYMVKCTVRCRLADLSSMHSVCLP